MTMFMKTDRDRQRQTETDFGGRGLCRCRHFRMFSLFFAVFAVFFCRSSFAVPRSPFALGLLILRDVGNEH